MRSSFLNLRSRIEQVWSHVTIISGRKICTSICVSNKLSAAFRGVSVVDLDHWMRTSNREATGPHRHHNQGCTSLIYLCHNTAQSRPVLDRLIDLDKSKNLFRRFDAPEI